MAKTYVGLRSHVESAEIYESGMAFLRCHRSLTQLSCRLLD